MSHADYPRLVLSEPEASRALGMSPTQLRRLRLAGKGPRAIRISDRRIGYRLCDLQEWVSARPVAL